MMRIYALAICPYCGHEQRPINDTEDIRPRPIIVTCDSEEGGCDRSYAVEYAVKVEVKVYKVELVEGDK
jgi:hypothetical protein